MAAMIVILAGSKADEKHYMAIANAARELGLKVAVRIGSAHKTAEHVLGMLREYERDPTPKVYVTVAGRSNALSGFVDGYVMAPVIACPPPSEAFSGADVFSSLRMPSGVAPAVVLEPKNAALFAAKILALADPSLRENVQRLKTAEQQKIVQDDREVS
jgi:phosphoribosylaminoimidazole carboxylase PurE protein